MSGGLRWIWGCWAALVVLLATTTGLAFVPLGRWNLVVAIAIASMKALIVVIFFMELRRSSGLVRVFAGAGFLWLLILLGLTGADYSSRHESYVAQRLQLHEIPAER
jgi:cytochrome c oxidase subunit 4